MASFVRGILAALCFVPSLLSKKDPNEKALGKCILD